MTRLLGLTALAAVTAAPGDRMIGGWALGRPAQASENGVPTVVQLSRRLPGLTITWVAYREGEGGSIALDFAARRGCRAQWLGARVQFDNPRETHEAAVRREVHDSFDGFRKKCGVPPVSEQAAMTGFGDAFAQAEKAVAEDDGA